MFCRIAEYITKRFIALALSLALVLIAPLLGQERMPLAAETTATAQIGAEEYFRLAQFDEGKTKTWATDFSPGQRASILKLFNEGVRDGISEPKQLKRFGFNLLYYFRTLNEYQQIISNPDAELPELMSSLESSGKNIEKQFTRYGTKFSSEGARIDKLFNNCLDERIAKKEEGIKEYRERIKLLEQLLAL